MNFEQENLVLNIQKLEESVTYGMISSKYNNVGKILSILKLHEKEIKELFNSPNKDVKKRVRKR